MHRLTLLSCAALLSLPGLAQVQTKPTAKQPLRVLFLGDPESPRTPEFRSFLAERFASVEVAGRWTYDKKLLDDADVVVLDWPQQDGISKWMLSRSKEKGAAPPPIPASPLGALESWTKPTVLVGSAGLNVAWTWGLKGDFG
jgi:hypothetical protein